MSRRRLAFANAALALACIVALAISLTVGPADISPVDAAKALLGVGEELERLIVVEVRLPRTLLALLIGASLGLAGACLQGYLHNPLAEPGLIGASASAAFGAVVVLYSGLAGAFAWALPLGGIFGAGVAVGLVWLLAGRNGHGLTLILAGVAVTSLASALTALALNFAPNPFAASEMMYWLLGSLADRSFDHVLLAAPFMAAGWALMASTARGLDALTLGRDAASTLGFDMGRMARRIVLGAALAVGAGTAVAGAIGFIGLVTPHLLRPIVGHRPAALLAPSALGGAFLLTLADVVARMVPTAEELKLGVLTALVGAPFFLVLILRLAREDVRR